MVYVRVKQVAKCLTFITICITISVLLPNGIISLLYEAGLGLSIYYPPTKYRQFPTDHTQTIIKDRIWHSVISKEGCITAAAAWHQHGWRSSCRRSRSCGRGRRWPTGSWRWRPARRVWPASGWRGRGPEPPVRSIPSHHTQRAHVRPAQNKNGSKTSPRWGNGLALLGYILWLCNALRLLLKGKRKVLAHTEQSCSLDFLVCLGFL